MDTSSKLKYLWTHRPPFIMFLLCLSSFGVTLFSLSVFVAQSEKIQNPDVLDWNKLLTRLTKLEFCLPSPESNYNLTTIDTTDNNDWSNVTLSVQVSEEFSEAFYKNVDHEKSVKATGQVEVKHLGRGIRPEFKNDILVVSFELPRSYESNPSACLHVQGPASLLKHLDLNDTSCASESDDELSVMPLLAHSPDHKPPSWCQQSQNDLQVSLDFEMDFNPDLTLYVSPQDKELIHLHLMVTSVFLFAVLAVVIIAYLIRAMTGNRKPIDARGDHHIIPMTKFGEN